MRGKEGQITDKTWFLGQYGPADYPLIKWLARQIVSSSCLPKYPLTKFALRQLLVPLFK